MTAYEQMREALVKIREKCVIYNNDLAEEIDAICGNALDLPPRNCDVGTVLEQTERQRHYCGQHYSTCDVDMECCRCPLWKEASCQLAWAQMPYTAEGKASR